MRERDQKQEQMIRGKHKINECRTRRRRRTTTATTGTGRNRRKSKEKQTKTKCAEVVIQVYVKRNDSCITVHTVESPCFFCAECTVLPLYDSDKGAPSMMMMMMMMIVIISGLVDAQIPHRPARSVAHGNNPVDRRPSLCSVNMFLSAAHSPANELRAMEKPRQTTTIKNK